MSIAVTLARAGFQRIATHAEDLRLRVVALETAGPATASWSMALFDSDTDCVVGDGIIAFCVPASLDGMSVSDVVASAHTAGTTGTMAIALRRRRGSADVDVLSTPVSIDSGEESSVTAAAAHVIDTANDDLAEGDMIYGDVDTVHTPAAKGLTITVTAVAP